VLAENCVFDKQSPEPLHCALSIDSIETKSIWRDPLSQTYGVNLPSSLRTVLSSALGYSPRLPVSVLVRICTVVLFEVFLGSNSDCSGITNRPLRSIGGFTPADLPTDTAAGTIATTNQLPVSVTASPPQFKPSVHSAGILTCCPSSTPFGPWADLPSPGNLRLSANRILTCFIVQLRCSAYSRSLSAPNCSTSKLLRTF